MTNINKIIETCEDAIRYAERKGEWASFDAKNVVIPLIERIRDLESNTMAMASCQEINCVRTLANTIGIERR